MSPNIFYTILFIAILTVVATVGWLVLFGVRRRRSKKVDDSTIVNGMFQTGMNHRFNTPERRR